MTPEVAERRHALVTYADHTANTAVRRVDRERRPKTSIKWDKLSTP